MSGNHSESFCGEPLNMGISIFAPVSSVEGSPTIMFLQPLLKGRVFASSAILIGTEFFLFLLKRLFSLESIPIIDIANGQTVQMPLSELQEFLRWTVNGSGSSTNLNTSNNERNLLINTDGVSVDRGFQTLQSPETPLIVALYIISDYSNKPYTPYISFTIPILTFPGLRGSLPLLVLGLIATIFVRAVVTPDKTGARPLEKPEAKNNWNNFINLTPNELLDLLSRFGKHFSAN